MRSTYLKFEDRIGERKDATGKTWEEIVELGIQAAEREMEDKKKAESVTAA